MQPPLDSLEKAVAPKPLSFGLAVSNIPTMNPRFQDAHDRKLVFEEGLAEPIHAWTFGQGDVPISYSDPDACFTMNRPGKSGGWLI